ncbi:MAG: hypothetical protein ABIN67_05240 [Ferruginibacter sp.]
MKKTILYSLLASTVLFSCRKGDNPKIPELTRVPVIKIAPVANSEAVIDVSNNPANFHGQFDVGLLFPQEAPPQKMDIVVIKNGNRALVKTLKTDVTTFPSSLEVTGAQLIALFGPIVLGDFFDIGGDMTISGGLKLEAFPTVGNPYSGGTANIPGSGTFLRYAAICKFNVDDYAGDFTVQVDDWQDFAPGDVVTLTKVDATHLSFFYGTTVEVKPIVITVNANNSITVDKVAYGRYGPGDDIYVAETLPSVDNAVLPCDKVLSIRFTMGLSTGATFNRTYLLKLKKK